jgi:hypothetical protein
MAFSFGLFTILYDEYETRRLEVWFGSHTTKFVMYSIGTSTRALRPGFALYWNQCWILMCGSRRITHTTTRGQDNGWNSYTGMANMCYACTVSYWYVNIIYGLGTFNLCARAE